LSRKNSQMKDIFEIIDEIKIHHQLTNDKDVADLLGTNTSNLANWKRRGTVPYFELIRYCVNNQVDIKSLICKDYSLKDNDTSIVSESTPDYKSASKRIEIINKILKEHPELEEHIFYYLKSLLTKPNKY